MEFDRVTATLKNQEALLKHKYHDKTVSSPNRGGMSVKDSYSGMSYKNSGHRSNYSDAMKKKKPKHGSYH